MMKNSIDSGIEASKSSWSFQSDKVAINFENHVKKSVPFYSEAQDLITTMSDGKQYILRFGMFHRSILKTNIKTSSGILKK